MFENLKWTLIHSGVLDWKVKIKKKKEKKTKCHCRDFGCGWTPRTAGEMKNAGTWRRTTRNYWTILFTGTILGSKLDEKSKDSLYQYNPSLMKGERIVKTPSPDTAKT